GSRSRGLFGEPCGSLDGEARKSKDAGVGPLKKYFVGSPAFSMFAESVDWTATLRRRFVMRSPSFRVQVLALILAALGTMYSDTASAQPAPAIVRAVITRLTAPAARGAASVEARAAISRYLAHEAEFTASSVKGGARLSASSESEIKGTMLRSEDVLAVCNKNPSVLREQASARLLQAFGAISKNKGASAHLADEFSQSTLLTILEQ